MMTKEIDKDNLILFPTDRIVKRNPNQGLSEKLQKNLELAKTKEYVEQAVDQIALDLLRKFVDMGINTKTPNFTKDLAMLVDTLRGLNNDYHLRELLSHIYMCLVETFQINHSQSHPLNACIQEDIF